jgi:hypothetical protein
MNIAKLLTDLYNLFIGTLNCFMGMGFRFIVFVVSCDNKDVFEERATMAQKSKVKIRERFTNVSCETEDITFFQFNSKGYCSFVEF